MIRWNVLIWRARGRCCKRQAGGNSSIKNTVKAAHTIVRQTWWQTQDPLLKQREKSDFRFNYLLWRRKYWAAGNNGHGPQHDQRCSWMSFLWDKFSVASWGFHWSVSTRRGGWLTGRRNWWHDRGPSVLIIYANSIWHHTSPHKNPLVWVLSVRLLWMGQGTCLTFFPFQSEYYSVEENCSTSMSDILTHKPITSVWLFLIGKWDV